MADYPNFYECIEEANRRLRHTIVMYDGEPYFVITIATYPDGIFRVYMEPLQPDFLLAHSNHPMPYAQDPQGSSAVAEKMDAFMAANPSLPLVRKMMNSPHFKKFRPFDLGMLNYGGDVFYVERMPNRRSEQGLTRNMLLSTKVLLPGRPSYDPFSPLFSNEMRDTILGNYPSFKECFTALKDPDVINTAAAFHRLFSLVKGPLDMTFLAYKQDIVGYFTDGPDKAVLGNGFGHLKEVITDLNQFAVTQ